MKAKNPTRKKLKTMELANPVKKRQMLKEDLPSPVTIDEWSIKELLERSKHMYSKVGKYPDEIKILALSLRQLTYSWVQIASICGTSPDTVQDWYYNPKFDTFELKKLSDAVKERLSDRLYLNSNTLMNHAMKDEKLAKANLQQLTWAMGVMIDKARLLENKSTENVSHIHSKAEGYNSKRETLRNEMLEAQAELNTLKEKSDIEPKK